MAFDFSILCFIFSCEAACLELLEGSFVFSVVCAFESSLADASLSSDDAVDDVLFVISFFGLSDGDFLLTLLLNDVSLSDVSF